MAHSSKKYALIVAGGKGLRMGTEIPKQFLLLKDKPVLMHTIEKYAAIDDIDLQVVLPPNQFEYWEYLLQKFSFRVAHGLVEGGETRFHSVRNGLTSIPEKALVAIHDGVRPLVSAEVINESFRVAAEKGNAVAAVRLKEALRESDLTKGNRNVNRNNYYIIQTPQTFKTEQIKKAYEKVDHFNFHDDASIAEEAGYKINLIEGDYSNIKITTPEDLLIAEALMSSAGRGG